MKKIYLLAAFVLALPSVLYSSTATVHSTDLQFNSGEKDQTQVNVSGSSASVKLYCQWEKLNDGPLGRRWGTLAYDQSHELLVLYGGWNGSTSKVYSDTWNYNTLIRTWVNTANDAPTSRYAHGMVSIAPGRMLMFGGTDSSIYFNSTYEYRYIGSNNWDWGAINVVNGVNISTAPSARAFFAMAASTNTVLLFGGTGAGGKSSETWIFDIAASSWSLKSGKGPTARQSACMAYNYSDHLFYMYGGQDISGTKNDLWTYNVQNDSWVFVTADQNNLSGRYDASMFYDGVNNAIAVVGGNDGANPNSDVWYLNRSPDKWYSDVAVSSPSARYGQCSTYVSSLGKAAVFGGSGSGWFSDLYYFSYRSTGSFVSSVIDCPFQTSLQWQGISFMPQSQPGEYTISFKISSSDDNLTWSDFLGPDGTVGTSYSYPNFGNVPAGFVPITTKAHNNKRYLRYKLFYSSSRQPMSPAVNSVSVLYNYAPSAPVLYLPLTGTSTGQVSPVFTWNNSGDKDEDALTYSIQIDKTGAFEAPIIESTSIVSGAGLTTSYSTSTALSHGYWYWRVKAWDTSYSSGTWSDMFSVKVDTVPPNKLTDLSAVMGPVNGSVTLAWTYPGDDGLDGSISNGEYDIRYATYPITSESDFTILAPTRITGIVSVPAKTAGTINIAGLADAVTYYFSMKIADNAANYSSIPLLSPSIMTNANPVLNILSPTGGENWSLFNSINWSCFDPNPGDSVVYNIYLSTDSGVSYGITITAGLSGSTTFYNWDTRTVPNGTSYKIKVEAVDLRGLKGFSVSAGSINIFNLNEAPVVNIIYPNYGEILLGAAQITWTVNDPNKYDTHTCSIYISSDSGNSFVLLGTTTSLKYDFDTTHYLNGANFKVKVKAYDSGSPQMSGEDICDNNFMIGNGNLPPRNFSLVSPPNNSSRSVFDFSPEWEINGDPNPEDILTYTLFYSTVSNLFTVGVASVPFISNNKYHIDSSNLEQNTTYYWKVKAEDELGSYTFSQEVFALFILDRYKSVSADGSVAAEILNGLPSGTYLKVDRFDPSSSMAAGRLASIQKADEKALSDRHIKTLGQNLYKISISDKSGTEVNISDVLVSVAQRYSDTINTGYLDGSLVRRESLKMGIYNEAASNWQISEKPPVLDIVNKTITTELRSLGVFTLMAAITPLSVISGVVNYPNPFAAGLESTRIRYVLNEDKDVTLSIYTLTGDLVWRKSYVPGSDGGKGQQTGYTNEVSWDGRNDSGSLVSNGMYLLEVKTDNGKQVRKIGVVK